MNKEKRIQEILKILDLPLKKQAVWLRNLYYNNEDDDNYTFLIDFYVGDESLADLAFKMRDEIFDLPNGGELLALGVSKITKAINPEAIKFNCVYDWWLCCAQPIHWICAALIAKILREKNENKT